MEEKHVVTCFLEHRGKIAIFLRSQQVGTYRGRWAGISGYIEPGTTPYKQALQELKEEAGLGEGDVSLVKEGAPLEAVDKGIDRKWKVHPYRFAVLEPARIRMDWEHVEMRWINPEELVQYETVPGLAETWERVAD